MSDNSGSTATASSEATPAAAAAGVNQDHLIQAQKEALEKEIASTTNLVGALEPLQALEQEFTGDPVYSKKTRSLADAYESIRRTRPDGNCFFRAIGYRYLELLLQAGGKQGGPEFQRFRDAVAPSKDEMVALGFPEFTTTDFYDTFLDVVDSKVGPGPASSSVDDLLQTFNDGGLSDYLVVFLRLLTSKQLQKEADFYQHFMENALTVAEFCSAEVEPMYHESDHIHVTALTAATGIRVRIMYLDRGTNEKPSAHDFPDDGAADDGRPRVHLLYRPGHYDVLYPKDAAAGAADGDKKE